MNVYIMTAGALHKIGMSFDPKRRRHAVHSPNGGRVILRRTWRIGDNACDVEKQAHYLLDESRVAGEWFHCPYPDVVKAVEKAIRLCKSGRAVRKPKGVIGRRPTKSFPYEIANIDPASLQLVKEAYSHVR